MRIRLVCLASFMSVDFWFLFGFGFFILCSSLYVVLCSSFFSAFLRLQQQALIWTHIHTLAFMFYRIIKNTNFFYYFYVFASYFFASIKAFFMSICAVFMPSLAFELYFVSTHKYRILYIKRFSLIKFLNFNRSKITFRNITKTFSTK